MVLYEPSQFPLTHKWRGLVFKYSFRNRVQVAELFQEALVLEWEVQQKIADLRHRENYFRYVLEARLKNIHNDWWTKHRVNPKNDPEASPYDFFDGLISVRPFDQVYYEELVTHISQMLLAIDEMANEIFLLRVQTELRWASIREKYFALTPKSAFERKVALIKGLVHKELMAMA